MPIGLLICFGPIVIAWMLSKPEAPTEQDSKKNR